MLYTLNCVHLVVSVGDYYQLPPVEGSAPYKRAEKAQGALGRALIITKFNVFIELTTPNFRQKEDPILNAMCTAARFCEEPSAAMLAQLNARFVSVPAAVAATSPEALWTASTWKIVDKLNNDHLEQCRSSGKTVVNLFAK